MNARHIKYGKTQNLFSLLINFLVLLKHSPQTLMKKKHKDFFEGTSTIFIIETSNL